MNKRHNPSDKDALDFDALFSDESAPIRADLVARVRRQIAEGSYDVPRRWEKALDRLYKELQPE